MLHRISSRMLHLLPDKQFIMLEYFRAQKKLPNLKNPQAFTEKIQWIKVYGNLEKYTDYVDKVKVRTYIQKTIGKKYLIPLIGVWDTFDEIPFEKLPKQFVLKATHGSAYNFICKDKSLLDMANLKKITDKWMNENFYFMHREIQYKACKPKLICEAYIDEGPRGLTDYKFFCKNGKPQMVGVIADRVTKPTMDLLDLKGKRLPVRLAFPNAKGVVKKPEKFAEMIALAKKLSKNFPFVRVDLYCVKGKIYFGELTFTPGSGLDAIKPYSADQQLGNLIDLSTYKNF